MDTVGQQEIWSFFDDGDEPRVALNTEIRKGAGHPVGSFLELARKIATLQYKNSAYVLLFRGQSKDWLNFQKNSSLKPELLRPETGRRDNPGEAVLAARFGRLRRAEQRLVERFYRDQLTGAERLSRQRILRWSILQHYQIAPTPLLDVSHSLRIAASFASDGAAGSAFLFVLAVPNLSGGITASAESGLQIVRLASVCPPVAVRPHIQEGYLLGEYPDMPDFAQKQLYEPYEIDFGRRLVAKFRFNPKTFWKDVDFQKVKKAARYPNRKDPLFKLAQSIMNEL